MQDRLQDQGGKGAVQGGGGRLSVKTPVDRVSGGGGRGTGEGQRRFPIRRMEDLGGTGGGGLHGRYGQKRRRTAADRDFRSVSEEAS